jgi:hypothetical protein
MIETDLTVVDFATVRSAQIISLLKTHIRAFREVYDGIRPIGLDDVQFPCAMIETLRQRQAMYSTGKYDIWITYGIWFYIGDSNRDRLKEIQHQMAAALTKLFSNNALGDLNTGNTSKFKSNPGFWITSEMNPIEYSQTIGFTRPDYPKFLRAGMFTLEVQDKVIV